MAIRSAPPGMGITVGAGVCVAVGVGVRVAGTGLAVGEMVAETGFRLGVGLEAGDRKGICPSKANIDAIAIRATIPMVSQAGIRRREEARMLGLSTKVADGSRRRS